MPRPKEVTAFMVRTKRASRFSAAKAGDAVKKLLPIVEKATEEVAQLERASQEAYLAETDPGRRSRYEEFFQKVAAIRRLTGELYGNARQFVQAFGELEQATGRIVTENEPQPTGSSMAPRAAKPRAAKPKVVKSKPEK